MDSRENKRMFQCMVCGRIHSRAEGRCPCGADLAVFGKWLDEPDLPEPDILKPDPPEPVPPEPDPPEPDPVPIKKGRRFLKVAGILAGAFVIFLICIFILDTMNHRQDDDPGHGEETADAAEKQSDDSAADSTDTPMPSESAVPTQKAAADSEEEESSKLTLTSISNETDDVIYSIAVYTRIPEGPGREVLGRETILLDGYTQEIETSVSNAEQYEIAMITENGEVMLFDSLVLQMGDSLKVSEEGTIPVLTIQNRAGEEISAEGIKTSYQEVYGGAPNVNIPFCNATNNNFKELYLYETETDDMGNNIVADSLKDGLLNPYDNLKMDIDLSTNQDVYLVDERGWTWYFENVDFSGVYCIFVRVNDNNMPELLLRYSYTEANAVTGIFYNNNELEHKSPVYR